MPKTSKQSYGEIIYALRGKDPISRVDLECAFRIAGIESPSAVSRYAKNLVDRGYLIHVNDDCWQLTEESMQIGIVMIKVVPKQSLHDVVKAVEASTLRFGERVTIETHEAV